VGTPDLTISEKASASFELAVQFAATQGEGVSRSKRDRNMQRGGMRSFGLAKVNSSFGAPVSLIRLSRQRAGWRDRNHLVHIHIVDVPNRFETRPLGNARSTFLCDLARNLLNQSTFSATSARVLRGTAHASFTKQSAKNKSSGRACPLSGNEHARE